MMKAEVECLPPTLSMMLDVFGLLFDSQFSGGIQWLALVHELVIEVDSKCLIGGFGIF